MSSGTSLFWVTLNTHFGISALRERYRKNRLRLWEPPAVAVGVAAGVAPIVYAYVRFSDFAYSVASFIGQGSAVLVVPVALSQVLVLMFGIYYLTSLYYFSNDIDLLLALPLKPGTVLLTKFGVVLIDEYLTIALAFFPAVAVYGIRSAAPAYYWPTAVMVFVLLPLIPLALSSAFTLGLMRLIRPRRSRDMLQVMGGVLAVAFYFVIQFGAAAGARGDGEEAVRRMLGAPNGLAQAVLSRFPLAAWPVRAMADAGSVSGLAALAGLVSATAVSLGLLYLLGERVFYGGLMASGGHVAVPPRMGARRVSRRGRGSHSAWVRGTAELVWKRRSPFRALLWREGAMLARNPVFLMTVLINTLMVPVALILPPVLNGDLRRLAFLPEWYEQATLQYVIAFAMAGIVFLVSAVNAVASTAVSREGRFFWVSRIIPQPARLQILAKLSHAHLYSLAVAALVFGAGWIVFSLKATAVLAGVVLSVPSSLAAVSMGLALDLLFPRLGWTDPQKAMKGNPNAAIGFFLAGALLAGSGYLGYRLIGAGWGEAAVFGVFFAGFAALAVALILLVLKMAPGRYDRI